MPTGHSFPPYLVERFRTWRERRFLPDRIWHARLAEEGQRPRAMVVSCCDSRIDTVQMFGAEPGDLFVVRNVANLVPPFDPDHNHHGTSAAVEYAVNVLRVAHIVVVGHSNCGGVAACRAMCSGADPSLGEGSSFIGRWMEILRPGYERVARADPPPADPQRALEQEAVRTSLDNLAGFPFVAEAIAEGRISLHGAWVDLGAGTLYRLDGRGGPFVPV
ncbi:MAG: carbonic anhydrase [Paracoccaceae bacterium]